MELPGLNSKTITIYMKMCDLNYMFRKKTAFLLFMIPFFSFYSWGQIGMGTNSPDASAVLDLSSSSQGFLLPRMTESERDAISSPANGLIIFNTTTQSINYYDLPNTLWTELGSSAVSISLLSSFTTNTNYQLTITNLSNVTISPNFSTSDIAITGISGVTVTAVDDTSQNIAPFASHTVNYTLSYGSVSAAAPLALQSTYTYGAQTTSSTTNGGSDTTLLSDGFFYDVITSSTGEVWLDRNLGAIQVATSSTDSDAYGDLYQWGRANDGHQLRNSSTTSTAATTDSPGHGDFILNINDWLATQDDTLWQGVSGTNNPCPSGYRIPTYTELDTERAAFSSNNSAGAFASLKLTLGGARARNNGNLLYAGSTGYVWSSTVDGSNVSVLFFNSSTTNSGSPQLRGRGISVRCIKD